MAEQITSTKGSNRMLVVNAGIILVVNAGIILVVNAGIILVVNAGIILVVNAASADNTFRCSARQGQLLSKISSNC